MVRMDNRKFHVGDHIALRESHIVVHEIDQIVELNGTEYCYYHMLHAGCQSAPILCAPIYCIGQFYEVVSCQYGDNQFGVSRISE